MDVNKLRPILNKESILKTANAKELQQDPQTVLQRYQTYALTHVPLGDTTKQLKSLERVVADNKTCAVGTIVGPYGYGKTSTAVHLWNELRETKILSVPPFLWVNLQQLIDAVYHWVRFEFQQGPAKFVEPLDRLYERYAETGLERLPDSIDRETALELLNKGMLILEMRPDNVVEFYSEVTDLAVEAGYRGLAVFTDELQVTVAEYKPSRDQFFNDLFQIVKDTIDRPGKWAIIMSMDDGTEGIISRMRNDLLQRMQRSALYFRVKEVYSRRQYPAELWAAFAARFGFDGNEVVLPETLQSIGEIAARDDLGAGPRMVTNALSLAVKHYDESQTAYTPLQFVDDFLAGQIQFDQRGKFVTAVNKALENVEVRGSEANRNVVKLLAAFPAGCQEEMLKRFDLMESFDAFPPLARKDLFFLLSEGYTLRYLLEEERPPEAIEQRLTQEFVKRYAPNAAYAAMAAQGFLHLLLLPETFGTNWKPVGKTKERREGNASYYSQLMVGTFDRRYPQRSLNLIVAALPQSQAPSWKKHDPDSQIELRFELNYGLSATEPSQLLVAPNRPDTAVFQFNLNSIDKEAAPNILPDLLFQYYNAEKLSPLLVLALLHYLAEHSGTLPDDINRVRVVSNQLRQFVLTLLLGDSLQVSPDEFASNMVGHERIRELFKAQCRLLYPHYETLITGPKWMEDLQYYVYAVEKVAAEDGVAVVRGRRPWETTKSGAADAFTIPGRSLSRLETLLDSLEKLIIKEEYSGRTADSPIRLRFQSHPLEKQWLDQLEASTETGKIDGKEGAALYAIELMRQAKEMGYLGDEIQQVLQLLTSRKYIGMDQRKGMLVRLSEETGELKEQIEDRLNRLEADILRLQAVLVEFEPERYPVAKLRQQLAETTTRDELEVLINEVRGVEGKAQQYAAHRAENQRTKFTYELGQLHALVQSGVPPWLSREFAPSPLQDLLEKQRKDYTGAYGTTLRDMRQLAADSNETLKTLPESPIETIEVLQKALPDLAKEADKLKTRLKSYGDLQGDLDAWHKAITNANQVDGNMASLGEKYGTQEWQEAMGALWQEQRVAIEANPLDVPSLHRQFVRQLMSLANRFNKWLQNRREEFERQRDGYESALNQDGVQARLRIPYDEKNPKESYNALFETVYQGLMNSITELQRRLGQTLQKIRYAEQVQRVNLGDAGGEVEKLLLRLADLQQRLKIDTLRDMDRAEKELLEPLRQIFTAENEVAHSMRQALRKRSPEGREEALLNSLQTLANNGDVDLYSLIVRQLDRPDETFDLDQLMSDLQTLFQKNQIGVRIRLI